SIAARTRPSSAHTAALPAAGHTSWISRPRADISWDASSRLNTPATHAATYSPALWPSPAAGHTPPDFHIRAGELPRADSGGRVSAVESSSESSSPPVNITDDKERSR